MRTNEETTQLTWWVGVCRIHWLHLCRGARPTISNECPGYEIQPSDREAPVMLDLLGMQSASSLPLLPGTLWPRVVAPHRVLSMGQIELFDIWTGCKQMTYAKLLETELFDHLTECKQMTDV